MTVLIAPAVAEPTVIKVLEPEAPPVPKFIVLVVAAAETPDARLSVCETVA